MSKLLKKIVLIVFLMGLLWSGNQTLIMAQTLDTLAQSADEAYKNGQYESAFQSWEALAKAGVANSSLYTNLALAAWQQGKQGQTLRYFLKAKQLAPRDAQVRHNLGMVEAALAQNSSATYTSLVKLPWWRLALSYAEVLAFTACFTFLVFCYWIWHRLKNVPSHKAISVSLFSLWILSLTLLAYEAWKILPPSAVVISAQANILEAPTLEAPTGEKFVEGQILQIKRNQGDFKLVKDSEGREVWLASQDLGNI